MTARSNIDMGPYIDVLNEAAAKADTEDVSLARQGQLAMHNASVYASHVWQSPQLSAQDKRQILDQTYSQMQVMSERLNEAMDRMKFGHAARGAPKAPDSVDFVPPDERVQ